jgi:hypothetical protein
VRSDARWDGPPRPGAHGAAETELNVYDALPDRAGQVFVFHLPGVIHRVIGAVPDQEPQRPRSRHPALGMERPDGRAIGAAVRLQPLVVGLPPHPAECAPRACPPTPAQSRGCGGRFAPGPALRRVDPSASQPTRANAHRRRTSSTPASGRAHALVPCSTSLARRCSRTRTRCPRSRLSRCPGIAPRRRRSCWRQTVPPSGQLRHPCVAWQIGPQLLDCGLCCLRAALQTGPVRCHRDDLLLLWPDFQRHPELVSHPLLPAQESWTL